MAILRAKDARKLSQEELASKLVDLKSELLRIKAKSKTQTAENPGRAREIRRTIARIYTVSRQV